MNIGIVLSLIAQVTLGLLLVGSIDHNGPITSYYVVGLVVVFALALVLNSIKKHKLKMA